MAIRTYEITLDAKNTIAPEPVYCRQGDKKGAVVIDATLMDNGEPVSLDGLTPMFKANTADGQAVIADSTGFNIVNASGGEFTYQVPSQLGSVPGKIKIAYFSFSDSSGAQSTFNVVFVVEKAADMTQESAKDWVSNLNEIIDQYNQWSNDAHNSWEQFVNENKEIIESIDPGGTLLAEVIDARRPDGGSAYTTLGKRLNAEDASIESLESTTGSLKSNSLLVNKASDFNKMSLLYKMKRLPDEKGVFQTAQKDAKTGYVYMCEQTDDAGTQCINKYDPNTGDLITSHNLNLTAVVWFEGNSLYHDATTDHVMFVLPYDLAGNWFIYDFDQNSASDPFKMPGQTKCCIDNTGQYFVNIDSYDDPGVNGYVTGFNVYDLLTVIAGEPNLVNYIPVHDGMVRGANKIQGFQMIDNTIYLGRGKGDEWYRTTIVDSSGAVTGDYVWDKTQLKKLIGLDADYAIESEGISWTKIGGQDVPVLLVLASASDVYYAMVSLNDSNGSPVEYTSGVTIAGLTRQDYTGSIKGLAYTVGGADDESLLTTLNRIRKIGSYSFTASEGNAGLAPEMASATGMAIVRQMDGFTPLKIAVTAVDYRNNFWSIYYDNGEWSRWARSEARVPLWQGSSKMTSAVTLNKPITPYSLIGIMYMTNGGQTQIAYGKGSISMNTSNNDGQIASISFYEAVLTFPTDTSAIVNTASTIGVSQSTTGTVTMNRNNSSPVTILEIFGVV